MVYKQDIDIANDVEMAHISSIASSIGLKEDELEFYGKYKAKIGDYHKYSSLKNQKEKLVLVTAINPTPAGEGKTTTTVGLADALSKLGYPTMAALREPSLGPVFGVKGGAAGGGYAQVVPMEDINLHFTGDFHAITAANNLLAAVIDNHIKQGNALQIDPMNITWKRVVDMNDRQLRHIIDGVSNGKSGTINGVTRPDGFDISVASEVMAVFCLSSSLSDLKSRLSKMIIGYSYANKPITCQDLNVAGALCVLLKDAIKPNLVQTLEKTPVLIHGGPFANIAHGCNSVIATKTACGIVGQKIADTNSQTGFVITEAGFGADLGAQKFIDIKCRLSGLYPDAVVIVASIRALKSHGGVKKDELNNENISALEAGLPNLLQHIENMQNVYGLSNVVALNKFPTDTQKEVDFVVNECSKLGVNVVISDVWAKGGDGGIDLANEVVKLTAKSQKDDKFLYDSDLPITEKIRATAQKIYHADDIILTANAKKKISFLEDEGFGNLPICMAKTQYSFSDDATKLGRPQKFKVTIKDLKVCAGAGFIVAYLGDIMTMPGLPKVPAANNIDIDDSGKITGLF